MAQHARNGTPCGTPCSTPYGTCTYNVRHMAHRAAVRGTAQHGIADHRTVRHCTRHAAWQMPHHLLRHELPCHGTWHGTQYSTRHRVARTQRTARQSHGTAHASRTRHGIQHGTQHGTLNGTQNGMVSAACCTEIETTQPSRGTGLAGAFVRVPRIWRTFELQVTTLTRALARDVLVGPARSFDVMLAVRTRRYQLLSPRPLSRSLLRQEVRCYKAQGTP